MMRTRLLLAGLAALMLLTGLPGLAQEAEAPTVAILRFGDGMAQDASEAAMLGRAAGLRAAQRG